MWSRVERSATKKSTTSQATVARDSAAQQTGAAAGVEAVRWRVSRLGTLGPAVCRLRAQMPSPLVSLSVSTRKKEGPQHRERSTVRVKESKETTG